MEHAGGGIHRPESPARPALQACDLAFRVMAGRRSGHPGCLRRTYVRCNSVCLPSPGWRTALQGAGSQVSRTYAEPVDVGVSGGRPIRFVWRGRLYTVLGVLDHWVISREWWKQQNPDLDTPAERELWRIEGVARAQCPGGHLRAAP